MDAGDYHSWSPLENDALSLLDSTDKLNWFTRSIAKNVFASEKEKLGDAPTQKQVDALNVQGNIDWLQGKDYITDKQASSFGKQYSSIYNQNFNPNTSYSSAPTPPTTSPNPFSNVETDYDIGVEDPDEYTTNIGTTKPAPSFKSSSLGLLGNAYAGGLGTTTPSPALGDYAPSPQQSGPREISTPESILNSAIENPGKTAAVLTTAKVLANARGWAERGASKADLSKLSNMSWKDAAKAEKAFGYNPAYQGADKVSKAGYAKQGIKSLFGSYAPGSNVGGGTPLSQKGFQYSTVKNVLNSPVAKGLANVANKLGTLGLAWGVGNLAYGATNALMDSKFGDNIGLGRKDFGDYGRGISSLLNREQRTDAVYTRNTDPLRNERLSNQARAEAKAAEQAAIAAEAQAKADAIAKAAAEAQAAADAKDAADKAKAKAEADAKAAKEAAAKAKAEADAKAAAAAEEARKVEEEKQRMIDNKQFYDTDSGSFDEGGNYSDWGSQEEYDDDFGEDSSWGDDGDSGGGGGGGGGGGSYIATATTQALGEEGLTVFNNWRDHMRNVVPEFAVSFGRYRVTAPKIVTAIDKKDNSKAIYKDIVADKDSVKAQDDYRVMVRELSNKHLKDKR